jgi:hypothetical protein
VTVLADVLLWLTAAATPFAAASPMVFHARYRTPGMITAVIVAASWATALLACLAWRLS